jgi:hypothetical protein
VYLYSIAHVVNDARRHSRIPRPAEGAAVRGLGREHCHHFSQLNLAVLAKRVGWKAQWSELAPRLRCMMCGHRGATLTVVRPVARCPMCQRPLEGIR